jgi:shikimate 5-dehydrogenase
LVYNPEETLLITTAKQHHLFAINGRLMLQKQAESAWEIFKG